MDSVVRNILTVAMAEFAQHGLAGARVDAIAAGTHTSKRMIYYHFGSKEGLYAAVVEHAFSDVRHDDEVAREIEAMAPAQALQAYAGMAFDHFCARPAFVRLVMFENLNGAKVIEGSKVIRQLNAVGLHTVERLLERGQADGSMRADVSAMNVYTNLVGLCFFHISNRHSFTAIFGQPMDSEAMRLTRREAVTESVMRYVLVSPGQGQALRSAANADCA